jgi:ankyrin repeat protein
MRDVDGDTPLHTACRCGAPIDVLEVLLRAYRAAVYERDYEGLTPVQRLWVRYFVILGDDVIENVSSGADLVGELLDAWNKTELLLRCAHHGDSERRSSSLDLTSSPGGSLHNHHHHHHPFRVVHAAASVDCPRAVVRIASKVYPNELNQRDEHGRTPLMIAASAPIYEVRDLSDKGYTLEDFVYDEGTDGTVIEPGMNNTNLAQAGSTIEGVPSTESGSGGYPSVIQILLEANHTSPTHGAHIPDPSGRLPLHLALSSGKRWNEGVQQLIAAYPDAVSLPDRSSKLYPFMLAASCGLDMDVTSTYEILRLNPCLIENLCKRSESQQLHAISSNNKKHHQQHPIHPSTTDRLESCEEIDITDKLFQATQL